MVEHAWVLGENVVKVHIIINIIFDLMILGNNNFVMAFRKGRADNLAF